MSETVEEETVKELPEQDGDQPETYLISRELAQQTVNYLGSRPWHEVAGLMSGMLSLEPVARPQNRAERRSRKKT